MSSCASHWSLCPDTARINLVNIVLSDAKSHLFASSGHIRRCLHNGVDARIAPTEVHLHLFTSFANMFVLFRLFLFLFRFKFLLKFVDPFLLNLFHFLLGPFDLSLALFLNFFYLFFVLLGLEPLNHELIICLDLCNPLELILGDLFNQFFHFFLELLLQPLHHLLAITPHLLYRLFVVLLSFFCLVEWLFIVVAIVLWGLFLAFVIGYSVNKKFPLLAIVLKTLQLLQQVKAKTGFVHLSSVLVIRVFYH